MPLLILKILVWRGYLAGIHATEWALRFTSVYYHIDVRML